MRKYLLYWLIPLICVVLLAASFVTYFLIKEEIRRAHDREAADFAITDFSLTVDQPVTPPGQTVTFTASCKGGKGKLVYTFYTKDAVTGKESVLQTAEQNTCTYSVPDYGRYNVFVNISDESQWTKDATANCFYGAAHKGVDVSAYQGAVDWTQVKSDGYDFAMVRAGYGNLISQRDANFGENVYGAFAAGLKVGAYYYSYAMTAEDAAKEASVCLEILKPYKNLIDYPVAFDIERTEQQTLSEADYNAIVNAFCEPIAAAGYTPILYTYDSWLVSHPDWEQFSEYNLWTASWDSAPESPYNYIFWQYSNLGTVKGVPKNTDVNYAFCDYSGGKKIAP